VGLQVETFETAKKQGQVLLGTVWQETSGGIVHFRG
jgi:hypothetical protein